MRKRTYVSSAAVATTVLLSMQFVGAASAAPGDPDATFGSNGTTYVRYIANDLAVAADGTTVVVGAGYVGRLLTNGQLDPSFGDQGYVGDPFGADDGEPQGVAVQPDGRIVIAGSVPTAESSGRYQVALARYMPDGTPDSSFSADGVFTMSAPSGYKYPSATDVALQPDGTVVSAGFFRNRNFIVRFTASGEPDPTFSDDGFFYLSHGARGSGVDSIVPGPAGSIYGAGTTYKDAKLKRSNMLVARVGAGGELDPQFSSDGVATIDLQKNDYAYDLEVQPDGNIVVAGSTSKLSHNSKAAFARLTPAGAPDPSFSGDGKAIPKVGTFAQRGVQALGLGLDGKIYGVGGYGAVVSLLASGEINESFGTKGVAEIPPTGTFEDGDALAIAPDGKLVVAGSGLNDSLDHQVDAVARIDVQ